MQSTVVAESVPNGERVRIFCGCEGVMNRRYENGTYYATYVTVTKSCGSYRFHYVQSQLRIARRDEVFYDPFLDALQESFG